MDQTAPPPYAEPDPDDVRPRRRSPGVTVSLLVLALPFLGWAALSLLGIDQDRYTAAMVALTQYAVPVGAVITLLALVLRRWLTTLVVGLATTALVFAVAPRAIPDTPRPVQGTPVRVLSVNLYFGEGQAAEVVDLVRRNQVDVLSLQELTPELASSLDRAGLAELLPNRAFHAHTGASGTGIASRYPLHELSLVRPTTFAQPSALIDLPGARDMEFVAVHPSTPVAATPTWRSELEALPGPAKKGNPRILAGDFNATLDHTPLRDLLGRGYEDAAEITGDGLQGTWPGPDVRLPPPMTIDHVLVSGGAVVQAYQRFQVDGSDHRAILAHLVIPG